MSIKIVSSQEKKLPPQIDITQEELEAIIQKAEEGFFYSLDEGWELVKKME